MKNHIEQTNSEQTGFKCNCDLFGVNPTCPIHSDYWKFPWE